MSHALKKALEAAHKAINDAATDSANIRSAVALESISESLETIAGALQKIANMAERKALIETLPRI